MLAMAKKTAAGAAGPMIVLPTPTRLLSLAEVVSISRESIFSVGWKNPFFLFPSRHVFFRACVALPTAAIDARGVCYINPFFMSQIVTMDPKLWDFVVAHEVFHPTFDHLGRMGSRNPKRWNRATDRWVNWMLDRAGIGGNDAIHRLDGLMPLKPGHELLSAEELYELEPEEPGDGAAGGGGDGDEDGVGDGMSNAPMPGQGCGTLPSQAGKGHGGGEPGDGEGDPGQRSAGKIPTGATKGPDSPVARQWREIAAQAAQMSRSAGNEAGNLMARIIDIPAPRVKWGSVLRGACARAVAQHGYDG